MENKEKAFALKQYLKSEITKSIQRKEDLDEKDWIGQSGILLTRAESALCLHALDQMEILAAPPVIEPPQKQERKTAEGFRPEQIASIIFYSPATNGKAAESQKRGADLIREYAQQETASLQSRVRELEESRDFQIEINKKLHESELKLRKAIEFALNPKSKFADSEIKLRAAISQLTEKP